jgi:hypothetical protein
MPSKRFPTKAACSSRLRVIKGRMDTLHSPHGASDKVTRWLSGAYTCPRCRVEFATLFQFNHHRREVHQEPDGLRTEK